MEDEARKGAKRFAPEDRDGAFQALLPDFKSDLQASLMAAMSSALGAGLDRMSDKMEATMEGYDKGIQAQFAQQQQQISAIAQRLEAATQSSRDLTSTITRLDKSLAAVESQTPIRLDEEGFDRPPDSTIVRI